MPEKKFTRCAELSFAIGIVLLGLGTSLMSKAGFGMSMVVAPAYVLSDLWPGVSTGTMCYVYQGILVLITCLLRRRFRLSYLFSFLSAVLFGWMVDFFSNFCFAGIVNPGLGARILLFCVGLPINSVSIAFLLHTYFPPQAPELFVKELAGLIQKDIYKVKYAYDLFSLLLSVGLSLLFFREFRYIGVGTFICAFLNGPIIGLTGRFLDKIADFSPFFPKLGKFFLEGEKSDS